MKQKQQHNRVRSAPAALKRHRARSRQAAEGAVKPSGIGPFGLNLRQERFCREYVVDGNGTQAAIRAGYATTGADVHASRLLGNSRVRWLIDRLKAQQGARVDASADRVREELARMAFFNAADFVGPDGEVLPVHALSRDQAAAIVGLEAEGGKVRKYKLADKRQAAVDLGRHFGMFIDRHEIGGDPGNPVRFIIDGLDQGEGK